MLYHYTGTFVLSVVSVNHVGSQASHVLACRHTWLGKGPAGLLHSHSADCTLSL